MSDVCSRTASPPRGTRSARQTAIGLIALALLAAIGVAVYSIQTRFNPAGADNVSKSISSQLVGRSSNIGNTVTGHSRSAAMSAA